MALSAHAHGALRQMLARPPGTRCLAPKSCSHTALRPLRRASTGPPRRTASKPMPGKPKPLPFRSTSSSKDPGPSSPSPRPNPEHDGAGFSSGAPPPRKFSIAELVRTRWIALFGAGAAALCLGSFTASFVWLNSSPAPIYCTGHEPAVPTGRPGIQSPLEFDLHLDKSEHRYGITKLRRELGAEAKGHVLEVAVGTGRNLEFYDWGKLIERFVSRGERNKDLLEKSGWGRGKIEDVREMESFTAMDVSESMLDIGLKRLRSVVPHGSEMLPAKKPIFADLAKDEDGRWCLSLLDGKVRILKGDAQDDLPRPRVLDGSKYDTVIQTFGLCSVRDPTKLLENMAGVVRPETGRIILLEHGRSWWDLVNGLLDRSAKGHFERFGCWWNRDIEMIVEDAQRKIPGLEVVEMKRPGWFKFGTHFWIELRVRDVQDGKGQKPAKAVHEYGEGRSSWWDPGSSILTPKPKDIDGKKN
ncbi:hypothetical protein BKA67DRAFT_390375 [Truncatella angustata]|uniref:S-adenosyl-L-methionine-dependent methyltransferase n=1 Tax=Truncatella angustata TaxID=152316 RepID=A0A9P8RK43_9PEZI|nr:uncharacterized protein BKA67DRAFT_390375 [Truncatella angustata]KAH6647530.1 hypothetical protein BKA67DRAFT_390375 [Truncatella angustata]